MSERTVSDSRFASLDGLRGVAALVVLFHHVAFVVPEFAETYLSQDLAGPDSLAWWFAYTPLKVLTAGPEAVVVFFLLSGFVLALEPLRKPEFDWLAYFPRRIVRLYVPIVASVLLAVVLVLLVPRDPARASSGWVALLADPSLRPLAIIGEATVLFHPPLFPLNGPLWSLVWEVWFSLLLPLAVALVVLVRRAWWVVALLSFGLSWAGFALEWGALLYLPMFMVGVAMARGLDDLRRAAAWISGLRFGSVVWGMLVLVSLLLIVSSWMYRGAGLIDTSLAAAISPEKLVGGTLLLFCCAFAPGAVRALTGRPVAWLGKVSFSLYLVHVPVLLAIAFAVGADQRWWTVVLAVPAALLVAWGFARVVEVPAHRLSRRVGTLVRR
ncbi:MAG: acyltransferase [Rhodoglobus sp.]|nr:acyltransferase [Rhodoglobus sp.]